MDLVMRLVRALLLLALLLAVAPSPGVSKEFCPQPCRCAGRGLLDCRHAGLATVPPASRRRALAVLDFTGNSIAEIGKRAWKNYPWAETLVLRDNELRAVKSHSLQGLFLLKHLDLSGNEIVSIEERAFEPLPFLKLLNLSGNGLTQIRSGTFQAWHGMQFLQELILSHNPLAVIADAAFFKLPAVSSLDLSATQVTPQTLLLFLQSTVSLESLQVPKDVACCLCQERPLAESPCRTIQFLCEKLCSTSAPQCAHTARLLQTRGEIMDTQLPRELNTSPVLSLKPKEPSLGDHGTVTFAVALTLSTEGDVSSLANSRTNSHPPQHLSGHEGKTSVDDLRAKLEKKVDKAESIKIVKSIVPHQPQPARLKDVEEKTPSSWHHKQQDSHLNWQALNPWDGAGGLNPSDDASIAGHHRDEQQDPAPRQNFLWTHNQQQDSQYSTGHNQLFYQVMGPMKAVGEPKVDQRLNRNLDFLSDPLVQSRPAASSRGEATAEEGQSSLGGHLLIIPDSTETHWKQPEEGSRFLNKPGSPQGPDLALVPGERLETTVDRFLRLLVPDKGLRTFMAHVEQALRTDCSLPQLQLACAKMVSKTGLLLKVLSERQENQGASERMGQCRLQANISRRTALEEDQEPTGKVCSQCAAVLCRQLLSRKSWLRRLSVKLQQRWRKKKYREAEHAEQDLPELTEADLLIAQYIMDVLDKEEEELQKEMQKENADVSQEEIKRES
ncbi:leucine-rich repeat-containing protein 37A3-like isoform X4 [Corvus hawaiiensis]|uniref:leucine-rich repeat-containing protein 37A3-like isoform X4 n=1 Tax=Corvus hawaiiensis TaxID=134902 RepID=UPI00201885BE|nr:leucine-rich repeat-containing protein 37A3-like isoform X4 [Corvus hawaiiensis]